MSSPPRRISSTTDGFTLWAGEERLRQVGWSEIIRIDAFKVDLLTMDAICLEIRLASGAACVVDDDATGFWELVATIKRALPESRQGWEQAVVHPAFAGNRTVIFGAEPSKG